MNKKSHLAVRSLSGVLTTLLPPPSLTSLTLHRLSSSSSLLLSETCCCFFCATFFFSCCWSWCWWWCCCGCCCGGCCCWSCWRWRSRSGDLAMTDVRLLGIGIEGFGRLCIAASTWLFKFSSNINKYIYMWKKSSIIFFLNFFSFLVPLFPFYFYFVLFLDSVFYPIVHSVFFPIFFPPGKESTGNVESFKFVIC